MTHSFVPLKDSPPNSPTLSCEWYAVPCTPYAKAFHHSPPMPQVVYLMGFSPDCHRKDLVDIWFPDYKRTEKLSNCHTTLPSGEVVTLPRDKMPSSIWQPARDRGRASKPGNKFEISLQRQRRKPQCFASASAFNFAESIPRVHLASPAARGHQGFNRLSIRFSSGASFSNPQTTLPLRLMRK